MQRMKLDSAPATIKTFVRSLLILPGGIELELDGRVVCRVTSPQQLTSEEKESLLKQVKKSMARAHERNRNVPARVIEREVREAVELVRSRQKK